MRKPKPFFCGELFGLMHTAEGGGRVGAVLLNAGLLHNVGPFRLYNRIADALAGVGITTARIDQSGKGESAPRESATDAESLLKDYDDVFAYLARGGIEKVILIGLCSAADDALELASHRESVVGVVMLDGYAPKDIGYFLTRWSWPFADLKRWFGSVRRPASPVNRIDIRNWRSRNAMLASIQGFMRRGGRLLAVYSGGVRDYYNHADQLSHVVGASPSLAETYFPLAAHTFPVSADRVRLVGRIVEWVTAEFPRGALHGGADREVLRQANGSVAA